GRAAGNTTFVSREAGLSPKLRPARLNMEGTFDTPVTHVTTIGKNEPRKMRKIAALSPTPKKIIETGIQAMGLIGRSNSNVGFITWLTPGYHPSVSPNGRPRITALPNPMATRRKESPI